MTHKSPCHKTSEMSVGREWPKNSEQKYHKTAQGDLLPIHVGMQMKDSPFHFMSFPVSPVTDLTEQ